MPRWVVVAMLVGSLWSVAGPGHADEPVADLVARHADAEALAALARLPASPEHRYLRGRLLERRGELAAAADAFANVEGLPDFAAEDARERHARLLARLGRCAEAAPLLEARRGGVFRALALECRARLALEAGEPAGLEAVLGPLGVVIEETAPVRGVDTFALRALLAEVLERLGRAD